MPLLGAHVSTAGGVYKCFANAASIGAECIQIFGASPRQWKAKLPEQEILKKYEEEKKKHGNLPVFLHASYLVNLATPKPDLYQKSIENLATHLKIANLLGAEGLIYHVGSYKDSTIEEAYKRVADGMLTVLDKAPGSAKLIMENAAGGGKKMGLNPEEIGIIHKMANSDRIKVCIDTQHLFGAGIVENYSPEEIKAFSEDCEKHFGLKNLIVMHINDSKIEFNTQRDRHENIGEGHIGLTAFQNLIKDKHFGSIPWLLEVPGFEGGGPDQKNMDIVRNLMH